MSNTRRSPVAGGTSPTTRPSPPDDGAPAGTRAAWSRRTASAAEVVLAGVAVALDLLLPALVLCAMAAVSLLVRRDPLRTLGVLRLSRPGRRLAQVAGLTVLWTALVFGVVMPVAEHLTGTRQDVAEFASLEGDLPRLLLFVVLSWTLAALVEELAFRGYLLTRLTDVVGDSRAGRTVAVVAVSALFALVHAEQGVVGMVLVFVDACYFGALRYAYGSLWAPVVGHGVSNTIGMVAFYLVGPFSALW